MVRCWGLINLGRDWYFFHFSYTDSSHLNVFWFIELNSFALALIICNNNLSLLLRLDLALTAPPPQCYGVLKQMKRKLTVRVATRRRSDWKEEYWKEEYKKICFVFSRDPNASGMNVKLSLFCSSLAQVQDERCLMMIVDSFISIVFHTHSILFFYFNFLLSGTALYVHRRAV